MFKKYKCIALPYYPMMEYAQLRGASQDRVDLLEQLIYIQALIVDPYLLIPWKDHIYEYKCHVYNVLLNSF